MCIEIASLKRSWTWHSLALVCILFSHGQESSYFETCFSVFSKLSFSLLINCCYTRGGIWELPSLTAWKFAAFAEIFDPNQQEFGISDIYKCLVNLEISDGLQIWICLQVASRLFVSTKLPSVLNRFPPNLDTQMPPKWQIAQN